ncbi:tyrosine-type recombinase/integrase [Hyphomicrobium zavarzinii]|uniref:tyrosine-type recombinase/integrase n=1 Tax=Hyphomicrobium zavarzinii TaxID=48292 RepID=UPI001FD9EC39|nr:site-specific integrase [Hyphomicrobium zavarzinii]
MLSVLSKLFSWAQDTGVDDREVNPCLRVTKYRLSKHERYLTRQEYALIAATVTALEGEGKITASSAYAIRLLMLTGARLNEILTLQWSFVRADMKSLFLPDSKTGEKIIRLSDEALAVLKTIPKVEENPYVITGHVHGTHLTNLHKAWYLVCETAKLDGVRIHDLRHSFASMAADSGASLPMIGGLLGHADPQTTARYVHLVDKRLHELNGTVGAAISSAMNGISKPAKRRAKPPRQGISSR